MTGEEYAAMKRRAWQREYYKRNRDRILAYQKDYNERNREKIRARHTAYMREYRRRNSKPDEED